MTKSIVKYDTVHNIYVHRMKYTITHDLSLFIASDWATRVTSQGQRQSRMTWNVSATIKGDDTFIDSGHRHILGDAFNDK